MKKILPVLTLIFVLIATPAFAKSSNHQDSDDVSASPSASCNILSIFKNHGSFVSCIAHLHEGGNSVSIAARSDVGKDEDENEDEGDEPVSPNPSSTPAVSPSPSSSPEVSPTPSESPSGSPEVSPSPAVSPSPSPLTEGVTNLNTGISQLISELRNLINSLKNLL